MVNNRNTTHQKQDRVVNSSGLKLSIFIVQKLALHKNGVEFCQQFNGDIRASLTALHDDIRCHATKLKNRNALTN